ncbi:monovalent cation/H(+) antiporter subunit G [Pseudogemmobacter faecipullorum]|uniref:Cation:proton antiporter n=1 Tax=Pseudogemmobacter faecipullorum TaxID=2755041 RepID=A0ABS8CHH8_9RHOB|nr:monovalent cation/H(+) antiporter subunit G [Pseudogemmobacter faecipullorum]MCB5408843.1 cation:proton antiporter [Pseudogemmobacter faecipullorum]
MSLMESLPLWIALPVAAFLILGATLTLLGAIGLVQIRSFYDRLHAPTLGTSWGAAGILLASMLLVSWADSRLVLHELVIGIFLMITTPVTLMFLGRAALHRDRIEGTPGIPGAVERSDIPAPPKPGKATDEPAKPAPEGFADPADAPGET